MLSRSFKSLVLFSITILFLFSAEAKNVIFFQGEVVGLSLEEASVAQATVSKEYAIFSGDKIVTAIEDTASTEEKSLAAIAKEATADNYISVSFVKLPSKIIVDASLYDLSGEMKLNSSTTISSLDEIVSAGRTLAPALTVVKPLVPKAPLNKVVEKPEAYTSSETTAEDVTVQKSESTSASHTDMIIGAKVGMYYVFGDSVASNLFALGFILRVDAGKILADIGISPLFFPLGGTRNDSIYSYGGINFELGANYLFSHDKPNTFFLGGGLQPRILLAYSDEGFGLAPYIQLGGLFMRNTSLKTFVSMKLAYNIQPIYKTYSDKIGITPIELGIEFGIGF